MTGYSHACWSPQLHLQLDVQQNEETHRVKSLICQLYAQKGQTTVQRVDSVCISLNWNIRKRNKKKSNGSLIWRNYFTLQQRNKTDAIGAQSSAAHHANVWWVRPARFWLGHWCQQCQECQLQWGQPVLFLDVCLGSAWGGLRSNNCSTQQTPKFYFCLRTPSTCAPHKLFSPENQN